MKYKFKFESLKKIKEVFEKKAQKELAAIQLEIKKAEEEYDFLLAKRMAETKKHLKISSAYDLKFHKNYIASLNKEMDVIRHKIDHLLNTKENKILELIEKSKEHEIINTLDEKHHEQFVHEQNKRDIISMDEIAANRFNSGRKN